MRARARAWRWMLAAAWLWLAAAGGGWAAPPQAEQSFDDWPVTWEWSLNESPAGNYTNRGWVLNDAQVWRNQAPSRTAPLGRPP